MAMMGFENFERMHPELLKTSSWADIGWHLRILLRCRPLPIKTILSSNRCSYFEMEDEGLKSTNDNIKIATNRVDSRKGIVLHLEIDNNK